MSDTKPETEKPQQTAQEVLLALETALQERAGELTDARDALTKAQDVVIAAHAAMFKAYQTLSVNKERYLTNIIGAQQTQSQKQSQTEQELRAALAGRSKATVSLEREDNVQ